MKFPDGFVNTVGTAIMRVVIVAVVYYMVYVTLGVLWDYKSSWWSFPVASAILAVAFHPQEWILAIAGTSKRD